MRAYFQVVDSVGILTVSGGEPLLNPHLPEIMRQIFSYQDRIVGSIDLATNCTLDITDELLDIFAANRQKMRLILDDYGPLSAKVKILADKLAESKISFRILDFGSKDPYCGGWIDFRDHSLKYDRVNERDEHGRLCLSKARRAFSLHDDGAIHSCARSFWRMSQKIIPLNDDERIDLLAADIPLSIKKARLAKLLAADSVSACAHCVGLNDQAVRHRPAEQLPHESKLAPEQ